MPVYRIFSRWATALPATVGVAALLMLSACNPRSQGSAGAFQMPPPEVTVMTVRTQRLPITTELPGRVHAYLSADVRARVDGIVLRRYFVEGSTVKAGQRLFQIDPAPYQAAYDSARASLQKAQAGLASAAALAARYKKLVAAKAVSQQDYDNAVAALGEAQADIAASKAAVKTARINLSYTSVLAPITGLIGKAQVTPGAYVQASSATLLATIQKIAPVYVDITQSSLDGLRLRNEFSNGQLHLDHRKRAEVSLILEDGSIYPLSGTLQFSDISVDPGTGSVTLRAVFPNPQHILLPGMFVRARLTEGVNEHAMLVPEVGISRDQQGEATAYVVGPDNKVNLRVLNATRTSGTNWVVDSGLKPGERVVIEGLQKIRPGMVVKPVEQNTGKKPEPVNQGHPVTAKQAH
jgi:membrane fusion protein (multidrug efflux system)